MEEGHLNEFSPAIFREMLRNGRRLIGFIWNEHKGVIIGLFLVFLVVSAAPFLQSGSSGLLINALVRSAGTGTFSPHLTGLVLILVLATFIPSLLYSIQDYLSKLFWYVMEEKFDTIVIQKKGEIDVAVHEDPKQQDLFNRITEEGTWRLRSFSDRQFFIIQNIIEVAIAAVVVLIFRWWVFLILLVGTLPELAVEMRYGRDVWSIHSERSENRRRYWYLHQHFERLPSLIELKLFQNTQYFLTQIRELFRNFQMEEKKNERKKLRWQIVALVMAQLAIAFASAYFVWEVVRGGLQIGTLVFVLASIANLRQSLSGLFGNLGRQYQDSLFVTDVFRLLDIPPALTRPPSGFVLPANQTPAVVFDRVSFAYPGTTTLALKDFSLTIEAGEKVALVGANGAGKTTFVKLLCRFYDPTAGRILVGGRDLKEINLESWYNLLGALFQDYAHYYFIVQEAIAIGRTSEPTSPIKVRSAAQASEASAFIEEWDKKYEQMLGKEFAGGIEPSIGQWQKLALARAFYRDARVLILDEPTASIDTEAEAKIFDRLEKLTSDRTVLLISHRFSTVRHATKIGVLENGQLKELGRHEDLLKLNELYARLFKLQARGYQ